MLQRIKEDFMFLKDEVKGVLLFGSHAAGVADNRSDIDICLVKPEDSGILLRVFERLGDRYDVRVFEDLPLHVKRDVIRNHKTVFGREVDISYYFYSFRKEWQDMEQRIMENSFKSAREMIRRRRSWINERKISEKA